MRRSRRVLAGGADATARTVPSRGRGRGGCRAAARLPRTEPAGVVQRAWVARALRDARTLSATAAGRLAGFTREEAAGPVRVRRTTPRAWSACAMRRAATGLRCTPPPGATGSSRSPCTGSLAWASPSRPSPSSARSPRGEARRGVHLPASTIWAGPRDEGLVWKRQQSWFHGPARHGEAPCDAGHPAGPGVRGTTGPLRGPHRAAGPHPRPLPRRALRLLALKTCPGGPYGQRGVLWVHAAFEPTTGEAARVFTQRGDSASHIRPLEHVPVAFPSERWPLVEDNRSAHLSRDTRGPHGLAGDHAAAPRSRGPAGVLRREGVDRRRRREPAGDRDRAGTRGRRQDGREHGSAERGSRTQAVSVRMLQRPTWRGAGESVRPCGSLEASCRRPSPGFGVIAHLTSRLLRSCRSVEACVSARNAVVRARFGGVPCQLRRSLPSAEGSRKVTNDSHERHFRDLDHTILRALFVLLTRRNSQMPASAARRVSRESGIVRLT